MKPESRLHKNKHNTGEPRGYIHGHLLEPGDVIEDGDVYESQSGAWLPADCMTGYTIHDKTPAVWVRPS